MRGNGRSKASSLATPPAVLVIDQLSPLGFKDAADAALEFGLRLHGFFEGRLDLANAEA